VLGERDVRHSCNFVLNRHRNTPQLSQRTPYGACCRNQTGDSRYRASRRDCVVALRRPYVDETALKRLA
jgi:hypothetical protein